MSEIEFYRCEVCGNIVALLKKGGGTLTCCGQAMTKLKANSTDGAKEKHVPVVTREGGRLKVAVGSVPHPMIPEHHIEWIALVSGRRLEFKYLKPGEKPEAEFEDAESGTVYEYCNLHGLWKADF
ncbi:MAG TPA: desulfoferrodoxin [Ruminococcaceae bacterium]|jgi:superoxide reductase|nr:desulfoferrodoxin [Oscillospiraceae bacterium]HBG56162.1 desulfoferrodoxin [Oscillospiraceae bacterium]HBQ46739.1 desulfoferrodoxin [Oscillospiraceae bacterium]HBT90870.1 desulfoferrodoxin [Oscillospiraceae bacterium]HCB90569.1 desulfoferrodoxin [Oscillospiraceae bacterium]